jgi:acetyltransferase-like isoleucine patch superfamily enzyme
MIDKVKSIVRRFLFKNLSNNYRIKTLRKWGVKIGENCFIQANSFSTEPYLIEIGNHVTIAGGTMLITHDGGAWLFRREDPTMDLFGKIKIGNNCFIGVGCIILPKTTIGDNCVIGAGSVVRGRIPDNSIAIGNPAKVIMKTNLYKLMATNSPGKFNTFGLSFKEKKKIILERWSNF